MKSTTPPNDLEAGPNVEDIGAPAPPDKSGYWTKNRTNPATVIWHALSAPRGEESNPSMNEKQKFLSKIDLFKDVGPKALERLAAETNLVYLPEGHVIRDTSRSENVDTSDIDGLYIIKSGAAKVTTSSESGEVEAVIAILREGNWFGEIGLIDGLPPSADVAAMSTMECFFLPRRAFIEALNENPEIALSMLPGLGRMVRSADQWISQLL